jgi:hypothetical protein
MSCLSMGMLKGRDDDMTVCGNAYNWQVVKG